MRQAKWLKISANGNSMSLVFLRPLDTRLEVVSRCQAAHLASACRSPSSEPRPYFQTASQAPDSKALLEQLFGASPTYHTQFGTRAL